jgi:hypothetical protein
LGELIVKKMSGFLTDAFNHPKVGQKAGAVAMIKNAVH